MNFNIFKKHILLLLFFCTLVNNYALSAQSSIGEDDSYYRSMLNNNAIIVLNRNYAGYKLSHYACSQNFTQSKTDEYLLALLSPNHKKVKYILLTEEKNHLYQIKKFGYRKLAPDTQDWMDTICGTSKEALEKWKLRDPAMDKWYRKPAQNGRGYFCIIRDDLKSLYAAYTCYQYDTRTSTFPILSVNYLNN